MSDVRFDAVLTALARARSRREVVAALAGVTVAGAAIDNAAGACRGRNERCKRKSECCSERCRSRKKKKRRKCTCSARGQHCLQTFDCCESGGPLICVSGFCVPDR